jgi:hypothetical protein
LFLLDYEISLLHSVQPTLSFTLMHCPMPVSDELFLLAQEDEWRALFNEWAYNSQSSIKLNPPSLVSFYGLFLHCDFLHLNLSVTPLQLRLLLCPIQSQISQHAQTYRFMPLEERFGLSTPIQETTNLMQLHQQEEFEYMLVKWNLLADRVFKNHHPSQLQRSSLLVAQLIWLELYICFDDVQLIAGKDSYNVGRAYLPHLKRWSQSTTARKAIAHAANVIQILQADPDNRPVWWPIAMSRVALVMWCYAVGLQLSTGSTAGVPAAMLNRTALISLNDPANHWIPQRRTFQPGEGLPCIQTTDGNLIPLHDIPKLFDFCLKILRDSKGPDSPILESTRQFLQDIKTCGMPYKDTYNSVPLDPRSTSQFLELSPSLPW